MHAEIPSAGFQVQLWWSNWSWLSRSRLPSGHGFRRWSYDGKWGDSVRCFVSPIVDSNLQSSSLICICFANAYGLSEMDNEARNLEKAQEQLSCQLSNLQSEIAELRSQMPALQTQQSRYTGLIASVAALGRECARMRRRTNQLSDCLLKDRKLLTQARMKMDRIAADLRSTKYAKTRREISFHLLEILQDLRQLHDSKDKKATKVQALSQAGNVIQRIKKRTPEMLKILEKPR